ncbi:MAG: transcriptional regulator [Spirochaetales bacterium]|nr:MAG: transcriptional regulator [Spirochaetales bacterium]
MDNTVHAQAREDFKKARLREIFAGIFTILSPEKKELLSFYDVKSILKPKSETYRGMMTVPIAMIAGSEGRYNDFDRAFLPRSDHMRGRWESVDRAHLTDVILPPVKLYKIRDAYFVKDGNHRVSVAKMKGVEFIDAEVVELSSEIHVDPGMTKAGLERSIIVYEKEQFIRNTGFDTVIDTSALDFSEPGRYLEILQHILGHKYYLNQTSEKEINLPEAAFSWFNFIYSPIIALLEEEGLLSKFPGRTKGDLYLWTVKHWDRLKGRQGKRISFRTAAREFSKRYGRGFFSRLLSLFKKRA